MTELPYSVEVLTATLAAFNVAWWPVVAVGVLACGRILFVLVRSDGDVPLRQARVLCYIAAGTAAVAGGPYWLGAMAMLDFMAPLYGGLWLLQAALMLVLVLRGSLVWNASDRRLPVATIAIGLIIYPILFWLETGGPGVPLAGSAPDPTAIVSLGLLACMRGRGMWAALFIPALWAGIAAFNGYLLGLFTPWLVAATLAVLGAGAIARRA